MTRPMTSPMTSPMTRLTTHPGEVLRLEFMQPLGISINQLARDLDISVSRVSNLVNEKREVTVDTAFRLAAYFQTTPEFWINLQTARSLSEFRQNGEAEAVARVRQPSRPEASAPAG